MGFQWPSIVHAVLLHFSLSRSFIAASYWLVCNLFRFLLLLLLLFSTISWLWFLDKNEIFILAETHTHSHTRTPTENEAKMNKLSTRRLFSSASLARVRSWPHHTTVGYSFPIDFRRRGARSLDVAASNLSQTRLFVCEPELYLWGLHFMCKCKSIRFGWHCYGMPVN